MSDPRKKLEATGYPWPGDHPDTGAPFVAFSIDARIEYQELRYLPPLYPSREYT